MPESREHLAREASELLFDRGTLVDLFVGKPTFQRKLRPTSLLLEDVIDDEALQLGNKRLMPKKALERHSQLETHARALLNGNSLVFPIAGARFVTYNALPGLLERLRNLKQSWDEATTEFVNKYETLRSTQLEALDAQTERLMLQRLNELPPEKRAEQSPKLLEWQDAERATTRKLYPETQQIPESFKFTWHIFRVPSCEFGSGSKGLLTDEEITQAQNTMRQDLQQWVRTALVEAHQALGVTAKRAREIFESQGRLHPRNLRPLFEAFETFNAIDFTGKSDWRTQIEEARRRFIMTDATGHIDMNRTAEAINSTHFASGEFKKLLDSIGSLAVEQTAQEAGLLALTKVGEFGRLVEI